MFGFPEQVNEKAARSVASGVIVLALIAIATRWTPLVVVLAVGFLLRVLAGPKLSPLGQLATKVIAPRLGDPKIVAGAPKRFAQGVGLVVTSVAAVAGGIFNAPAVMVGLLAVLVVFATLEAVVGFCAGCWMYARLMAWGVVADDACVDCADITKRAQRHTEEVPA